MKCIIAGCANETDGGLRVELASGRGFAVVDEADLSLVSAYRWYLHPEGYAYTVLRGPKHNGIPEWQYTIYMHRLLVGAVKGEDVHHADDDRLNNRRSNLVRCSRRAHMLADGRCARLQARARASRGVEIVHAKPCTECGKSYKPLRRGLCTRCASRSYRAREAS